MHPKARGEGKEGDRKPTNKISKHQKGHAFGNPERDNFFILTVSNTVKMQNSPASQHNYILGGIKINL